jgi:hypothetical protein
MLIIGSPYTSYSSSGGIDQETKLDYRHHAVILVLVYDNGKRPSSSITLLSFTSVIGHTSGQLVYPHSISAILSRNSLSETGVPS